MLANHSIFKFVNGSRYIGQSKDKVFVVKMFVDLPCSGMNLANACIFEET